jgi:hypothetical protein
MITVKIESKAVLDFLKNQQKTIKRLTDNPPMVSTGSIDLGSSYFHDFLSNNMRLVRSGNKLVLAPNNNALDGISAQEIYQTLEFGSSERRAEPVSPILRRYVRSVIIPKIIREMERQIG